MARRTWTVADSGYEPRPQFEPLHKSNKRWAAIVAHRRAGKTVACVMDLLISAIAPATPRRDPRFAYIAPTYTQAKDVAWSYLKQYGLTIPGATPNESELRLDLPNGGRVRLYGADNYDRLRGLYLDGVVLDEYGDMDPRAWPEVIRPTLSDRKGWAIFIGTPKGSNHFREIFEYAQGHPDWMTMMLRASETNILPKSELDDARNAPGMTEDLFLQEYECSFEAAVQGAYYAKELQRAEEDKRIGNVPYDSGSEVHTAWDLGIGDSTAIWFMQAVGKERRVIDYYEASGVGLDHYVKVLRDKPYIYGTHYLPHDVDVMELGTGKSRKEILQSLGLRDITVCEKLPVDDGIQAARVFLSQCWFDAERCKEGLDALKQYRREPDEKKSVGARMYFKPKPLHDWTSHAADAFRYLSVGFRPRDRSDWSRPLVANMGTIA